jgi:hypothetical protein
MLSVLCVVIIHWPCITLKSGCSQVECLLFSVRPEVLHCAVPVPSLEHNALVSKLIEIQA